MHKRTIEVASLRGVDPLIRTWQDVHDVLKDEFGDECYSFRHIQRIYNAHLEDVYKEDSIRDIQIEKYQLQDTQREYRAVLRDKARENALLQRVSEALSHFKPIPYTPHSYHVSDNYMVFVVSDWHIGAKYENFLGEYDLNIAKQRIDRLTTESVKKIRQYKPKEVLVINLNDLIEGNIHISARVQAEFDAIQQTIIAGELLAQFIAEVANHAPVVKVGQVLDNHSRINKNKREHIEAESFGKFVEYIVKERVKHPNVSFIGNTIDDNIGFTQFGGRKIAWVHGHLDHPKTVKDKLTNLIGLTLDQVYIAHRHHIDYKGTVLQSGSLKGADEYAFNHRLGERPSQSITIFNDYEFMIHNVFF